VIPACQGAIRRVQFGSVDQAVFLYNQIMKSQLSDTHPKAAAVQRELLLRASPARKLALVEQMSQTVVTLAAAGLHARFPKDTPAAHRRRLAGLLLGETLALKVYGPLPDQS